MGIFCTLEHVKNICLSFFRQIRLKNQHDVNWFVVSDAFDEFFKFIIIIIIIGNNNINKNPASAFVTLNMVESQLEISL